MKSPAEIKEVGKALLPVSLAAHKAGAYATEFVAGMDYGFALGLAWAVDELHDARLEQYLAQFVTLKRDGVPIEEIVKRMKAAAKLAAYKGN